MILPILFSAVVAGITTGASVAAFFGISATAGFLLAATAGGLAANYLKNKIPTLGAPKPQDRDYRVSTPAAVTPARHIYGRARVGGVPIFFQEFTRRHPNRQIQTQVYAVSEGPVEAIEAVWVNGRKMPHYSNSRFQLGGGATRRDGLSGTYLNQPFFDDIQEKIAVWTTRRTTLQGVYSDLGNLPRGVDTLHQHIQGRIDDLEDQRDGYTWNDFIGNNSYQSNLECKMWDGRDIIGQPILTNRTQFWSPQGGSNYQDEFVSKWDNGTHRLHRIAAVEVRLQKSNDETFLTGPPRTEFLIKGKKLTWPGQSTPTWTENAAAIYYDWLVNIQGIDPDDIDRASFDAAYSLCNEEVIVPTVARGDDNDEKPFHAADILEAAFGDDTSTWPNTTIQDLVLEVWNSEYAGQDNSQIKYSINGVVDTSLDPQEVERQFNTAWAGHIVERGGKIYFEPGKTKPTSRTIGEEDLVVGHNPTWQVEPPLSQKMTSVSADLTQSASHEWINYSAPKVRLEGEDDDFPQDLGTWSFVAYPTTATRLLNIFLKRANGGKTVGMKLTRGTDWANFRIAPADRVSLNLLSEGQVGGKFFVEEVAPAFDGTVDLTLSQEADNTYDEVITLPLELGAGSRFGAGNAQTISVPQDLHLDIRYSSPLGSYTRDDNGERDTYNGHRWDVAVYANGEALIENASGLEIQVRHENLNNLGADPVSYAPWRDYPANEYQVWIWNPPIMAHTAIASLSTQVRARWNRNGIISGWSAITTRAFAVPTNIPLQQSGT